MSANTKCIRREYAYWTSCRCDDCTEKTRLAWKRFRVYGYNRPTADRAWARIEQWLADGYSTVWIASACGVRKRFLISALYRLEYEGHRQSFGVNHTRAILAADIDTATAGRRDATGTRRRLRALACMGWSVEALEPETGLRSSTLAVIRRRGTETVSANIWRTIKDAYERLEMTPGPSRVAKTLAGQNEWHPPLAWDDIERDPEPVAVQFRKRDTLGEYRHLTGLGVSHEQALKQLDITQDGYDQALRRERGAA